jgi:hypothetical protein
MSAINMNRVIVGGLAAGLVINVSEYILNEPVLGEEMAASLTRMNLPPIGGSAIAVFVLMGFATGIALVWLYAAIRPRFGAGPMTAVTAGVIVWALAYLYPSIGMGVIGFFETGTIAFATIWGLVELIVAGLVGGKLYTEA